MAAKNITKTAEELIIRRTFDAPRKEVWRAWTDPDYFKQWWGPKNFTCPFCNIDFRVGGKFLNSMRFPDGAEIWGTGEYKEIVPMEKIVNTDSFADENGNVVSASHYGMSADYPMEMMMTVLFKEEDGKTEMTLRHKGLPSGEEMENARKGWNESFDKLEEMLNS